MRAPTLVTGANGHLGRRLARQLARAGEGPVRALVRSERAAGTLRTLPEAERPDEIRVVDWDDAEALAGAAQGCDSAVHLVGILKESPRARYVDAHEGTCRALASAAEKVGLRRVVYPSLLGAAPEARSACLASKGRAERILLEGAVPARVLRVPMVLGRGELAAEALAAKARARRVALVRGGATLEQPIDGEDLARGVRAALAEPAEAQGALELAGPECLSHRELLRRAAALLGRGPPRIVPVPLALARALAFAAERLLPEPPVTRAMLEVLEQDDCIDPEPACARLGLALTPLEATLRASLGLPEESSG